MAPTLSDDDDDDDDAKPGNANLPCWAFAMARLSILASVSEWIRVEGPWHEESLDTPETPHPEVSMSLLASPPWIEQLWLEVVHRKNAGKSKSVHTYTFLYMIT